MNKYLIVVSFLFTLQIFAQDLKTTEVNVVEGFKVSVPQADKLNQKASFQDTSKTDKTQEYSFIDKYIFTTFETRPLSAAKLKSKEEKKNNLGNINIATGNQKYRFGNLNYSGKLKQKIIYGVGVLFENYKYKTTNEDTVSKETFEFYLNTKSIFKAGILNSSLTINDVNEFHQFSAQQTPAKTYSTLLFTYNSREVKSDKLSHFTQLKIHDFNNQLENHIALYSKLKKSFNNRPFEFSFQFNNYINYKNKSTNIVVDVTDVKTFDFNPNLIFEKNGFNIDIGLNLAMEIEEETSVNFFPIIDVKKELVDNIVNLSFGIDRYDFRNTISSLTLENPYIHTPGINTSLEDSIGYFHDLRSTDVFESYVSLDNRLSSTEMLKFKLIYGKIINLHYFYFDQLTDLNRFKIDYINSWRFLSNVNYFKKFNNVFSLNFSFEYRWLSKEVPYKPELLSSLEFPITFAKKIKIVPSIEYIGERKHRFISGLSIEPPEVLYESLEELYLTKIKINYFYSEKLDFSISVNNILNQRVPYWFGYDKMGLNFNLSLNYIF